MNFTWESSDSGFRAVVRAKFASGNFRIKDAEEGVQLIIGKQKPGDKKLKVQSIIFDVDRFSTLSEAQKWTEDNKALYEKEFADRSGSRELDSKTIRSLGGVNKRVVAVHAAPGEDGVDGAGAVAVSPPDESQLEAINQYTRSLKSADQVAVFPVLACNDVIDRDVDQFTTECVTGFMNLEGPLSPLGKSFMVGHNYSSLPVGRIFDGESMKANGITWLKLWTYIPNTDQYQAYLENVDFGIYWAVSVGVMLNAATCSIGDPHEWGWYGFICSQNHVKGERYDPKGAEADAYGYPMPDESGTLCYRQLSEPSDFYELSQVYLGAQYMAEYDKGIKKSASAGMKQQFAGVTVKNASDLFSKGNVLSIKAEEAVILPTPKFPIGSRISQWTDKGNRAEEQSDGTYRFVSEEGLVYTFDPADGEELCLGRSAESEEDGASDDSKEAAVTEEHKTQLLRAQRILELAKAEVEKQSTDEPNELVSSLDVIIDEAVEAMDAGETDDVVALLTAADALVDKLMEAMGIPDPDEAEEEGGNEPEPTLDNASQQSAAAPTKASVKRAAIVAGLPSSIIDKVAEAADADALKCLLSAVGESMSALQKQVADSASKAALGDVFIKELRADVIHWYTMSQRDGDDNKGVNTDKIERLLTMCGDNADLIKEQRDLYRDLARAKFPEAVRRSTFPENANERHEESDTQSPGTSNVDVRGVKRIHG